MAIYDDMQNDLIKEIPFAKELIARYLNQRELEKRWTHLCFLEKDDPKNMKYSIKEYKKQFLTAGLILKTNLKEDICLTVQEIYGNFEYELALRYEEPKFKIPRSATNVKSKAIMNVYVEKYSAQKNAKLQDGLIIEILALSFKRIFRYV